MSDHQKYRFSVTTQSDDLAVIGCLRALADYSQKAGNRRIAWSGTTDDAWKESGSMVTFRFTEAIFRDTFREAATRLLVAGSWVMVATHDNDPATPRKTAPRK